MRNWPYVVFLPVLGAAIWLVWRVRDVPLQPAFAGGLLFIDSLSAFFMLLFAIVSLGLVIQQKTHPLAGLLALLLLLAAAGSVNLFGVALSFLLVTLVFSTQILNTQRTAHSAHGESDEPDMQSGGRGWWRISRLRLDAHLSTPDAYRYAAIIWSLLPCVCLGIAYGGLATQAHTWRYTVPGAGTALNSFVFWFGLLATLLGSTLRVWDLWNSNDPPHTHLLPYDMLLTVAWFYPLARFYSLGPWNLGWHFAAMLAGGAIMLWAAWRAVLASTYASTTRWLVQVAVGMALVGIGMGTSAGIVLGCYALLVAALLSSGIEPASAQRQTQSAELAGTQKGTGTVRWAIWLLCGAVPLTAPFVAFWMGVGAAAAGGLFLLAGIVWIAALLSVLTTMRLTAAQHLPISPGQMIPAALASVGLGVTSPLIVHLLIRPVVQQLQGGLTPFGDIVVWPWGGLVALDAARQQVATLPSMTIFALMLVLGALAWLIMRLGMALKENKT